MRALRNFCHTLKLTTVVGLLQPQPETWALFDSVILLSNGKASSLLGGGPLLTAAAAGAAARTLPWLPLPAPSTASACLPACPPTPSP